MDIQETLESFTRNSQLIQDLYSGTGGIEMLGNWERISYASPAVTDMALQFLFMMVGIYAMFFLFLAIISWRIFAKAGKPGWTSLIPIYNIIVFLEIVRAPTWWIILLCVPLINVFVSVALCGKLARVFWKGSGFALGMILAGVLFMPMLAFGSATYREKI